MITKALFDIYIRITFNKWCYESQYRALDYKAAENIIINQYCQKTFYNILEFNKSFVTKSKICWLNLSNTGVIYQFIHLLFTYFSAWSIKCSIYLFTCWFKKILIIFRRNLSNVWKTNKLLISNQAINIDEYILNTENLFN